MYSLGQGVVRSDIDAAWWLEKSAAQGNVEAQYRLSALYEEGRGVPRDYVSALMWAGLAATQGYEPAIRARQSLLARMSAAEVDAARQRIEEWGLTAGLSQD
jgi:TPR repeat protein